MNLSACPCSVPAESAAARIKAMARRVGAVAVGFARAGALSPGAEAQLDEWLSGGNHGTMEYMQRQAPLRRHPQHVLPGVRTLVCMAFPYRPAGGYHHPCIADYALGADYHRVLRQRLQPMADYLQEQLGALARICVDTAPVAERYWAVQAGLGIMGLNGQLIVPGVGSGVFLAEVLTTLELPADEPMTGHCGHCGRCVAACPGGAIKADGTIDARRCLSYLTIEHRGDLPDGTELHGRLYGCDACQRVCPHNAGEPPEPLADFVPDARLCALDAAGLRALSGTQWRKLAAGTARERMSGAKFRALVNKI